MFKKIAEKVPLIYIFIFQINVLCRINRKKFGMGAASKPCECNEGK